MNPAIVAALTRLRSLSAAQARGVATVVARVYPRLLVEQTPVVDEEALRFMWFNKWVNE